MAWKRRRSTGRVFCRMARPPRELELLPPGSGAAAAAEALTKTLRA